MQIYEKRKMIITILLASHNPVTVKYFVYILFLDLSWQKKKKKNVKIYIYRNIAFCSIHDIFKILKGS